MKNISDTEAYTVYDHVFSGALRALSRLVGLKRLTQPFWKRWQASGVDEQTIFEFLDTVGTIDNWASTASKVVDRKIAAFKAREAGSIDTNERIRSLRELSYLCYMAQWGCMPMTDERRRPYRQSRDFYLEAEKLAFGANFKRIDIPWKGQTLHGNLHLQPAKSPLIILVYGIDGCKEEHLATELALHGAGFSTLCFDGPGQGEALILDAIHWHKDFPQAVTAAITGAQLAAENSFTKFGAIGISIGGTWLYQCAVKDPRIDAIYDLGAPLHTRKFGAMPFLIKTRMCQVTGARTQEAIEQALSHNNIEAPDFFTDLKADIRILHGDRDRVVDLADKQHLLRNFETLSGKKGSETREISLRVVSGGDHCCTNNAELVRDDIVAFFTRRLLANPQPPA